MEATIVGILEGYYRSYIGIMEKKTEATIMGLCIYMDIRGVKQNDLWGTGSWCESRKRETLHIVNFAF